MSCGFTPAMSHSSRKPFSTPSDWSGGVLGTLWTKMPRSPSSTRSVFVPPTSTPTRAIEPCSSPRFQESLSASQGLRNPPPALWRAREGLSRWRGWWFYGSTALRAGDGHDGETHLFRLPMVALPPEGRRGTKRGAGCRLLPPLSAHPARERHRRLADHLRVRLVRRICRENRRSLAGRTRRGVPAVSVRAGPRNS